MRSLFWTLLFAVSVPTISATCYWQNSTLAPDSPYSIAPDDTACFPDQENSPCCGTGWSCLSDGVCYIEQSGNGFYYRGTCTDRTWDSQQCPGWCFAENSNTSIPLLKCTEANGEDWYCCPGDENCSCDTGVDALKLGASQPTTVTVIGSTTWPGYVSATSQYSTSAFALDGTTSTQTGSASASTSTQGASAATNTESTTGSRAASSMASSASAKTGTSIARATFSTTGSGTAGAASASSTDGVKVVSKSNTNTGAIAGGVVSGVILLALIGGLGWLFGRRHSGKKTGEVAAEKPYAPEMATGNDQYVGAWAASQQKDNDGHVGSELPSTGSHTFCEAPGDGSQRHELGGLNDGPQIYGHGGRAEMQA